MSDNCTHDCGSCSANCGERKQESLLASLNSKSKVKKVIAVVSGKGGVGKSLVTSMLAVLAKRKGKEVAVLDADITGPSIPKAFGLKDKADGDEVSINTVNTSTGIKVMSLNLLIPDEASPVVWRGPIIAGTVKQFWTDVNWGDVDVMFIDCPPGTGDVPLTVFQSIPVDGIIVVTSPQELVSVIVEKAVRMAELMNIPVLGIVENYSYFICDKCGEKHNIYGESHLAETASKHGITNIAQIPFDPAFAKVCDSGKIEEFQADYLDTVIDTIL